MYCRAKMTVFRGMMPNILLVDTSGSAATILGWKRWKQWVPPNCCIYVLNCLMSHITVRA